MRDSLIYSFPRYLAAKKSVDDRALNKHVWQTLSNELARCEVDSPLRVLEIGAGVGSMIERILQWGLLKHANYTALDLQPENITQALTHLPGWASQRGYQVTKTPARIRLQSSKVDLALDFKAIDLSDFIARESGQRHWDLIIAHAFLDLLDIPFALPQIFSLCAPNALFYFSINFDGLTLLEPVLDPDLDAQIQALYHRSMDERRVAGINSGDSRAGRHLFANIIASGGEILDAGSSDWVVFPTRGAYTQDEAYFLHFIIHTIHQELALHPDLNAAHFEDWVAERHAQINRFELVYIAHQLDFVGRFSPK